MQRSMRAGGRTRPAWMRIGVALGAASLVAVVATEVIYLLGSITGLVDRSARLPSPVGMGPLSPLSVAVTALVATLGAGLLFSGLTLTTRHPVRNFRVLATVLALLSLSMPVTIPGPSAGMRLVLLAMHGAVWAATISILAGLGRTEEGR